MKTEEIIIVIVAVLLGLFILGSGFSGMMGYGMMSGFGGMWLLGWLFAILIIIALVLFIIWLIKQISETGRRK